MGETAIAFGIDTETFDVAGGSNEIVAATPLPMAFEFRPLARQVYAEAVPAQLIDLPAATKAGPGDTVKPVTPGG
ncbi:MAG: hypothetical protein WBY44_04990 [Bryobacteraceae bacterium]